MMGGEIFLDALFSIALASRGDAYHDNATRWSQRVEAAGTRLVTTRAVMMEVGNALSNRSYRAAGVRLLDYMESDPRIEIVEVTRVRWEQGLALYRDRADKDWGITDCLSFAVMQERGMTAALTADIHFVQAGFRALLREAE